MGKSPLISIIIPTWNRKKKLKESIESVLKQSVTSFELLICDDGSTDDSKLLIEYFNDDRIKWIDGIHSGRPSIPRNKGIKYARGEWLAFIDSDDQWLPSKLESQLNLLKNSNSKACCTNAYIRKSNCINEIPLLSLEKTQLTFNDIVRTNHILNSSVIFHKSLIEDVIGFPEEIELKAIEDYALWLRILTFTNFNYMKELLVIYNDDVEDSIRWINKKSIDLQRYYVFKNLFKWLGRKKSGIIKFIVVREIIVSKIKLYIRNIIVPRDK